MEIDPSNLQGGFAFGRPAEQGSEKSAEGENSQAAEQDKGAAGSSASAGSSAGSAAGAAGAAGEQGEQQVSQPNKYSLSELGFDESQYKGPEDIRGLRISERLAELPVLNTKLQEYQKTITELQSRMQVLDSPLFATSAKYASFAKESGIESFDIFKRIAEYDDSKVTDLQALVLREVCETPEFLSEMSDLQTDLQKKYRLGEYASEVPDPKDDEKVLKVEDPSDQRALKRDALAARKYLAGLKAKVEGIKFETGPAPVDREKVKSEWSEVSKGLLPHFKKLDLPKEIDGVAVDAAYQITPEDQPVLSALIEDAVKNMGDSPTKESVTALYQQVYQRFYWTKLPDLFKLHGDKLKANLEMNLKQRYANFSWADMKPDRKVSESNIPAGGKTVDQMFDEQMAALR